MTTGQKRRKDPWSHTAGRRPNSVIVEEVPDSPNIYMRVWDAKRGDYRTRSLRHSNRELAVLQAEEAWIKRLKGQEAIEEGRTSVDAVFRLYVHHRTPHKAASGQAADKAHMEFWKRVLGPDRDPHTVSIGEIEAALDRRRTGAIDARGNPVPEKERRPVGTTTVAEEISWLKTVFAWACRWRLRDGRRLVKENPLAGFRIAKEKNPRRPLATRDRLEALRAKSDQVTMQVIRDGKRLQVRSYLTEILDIVAGTGRRIGAVCQLEYRDLLLDAPPNGAIVWRAETDKTARRTVVPISPQVRAAIDRVLRERPGIGAVPLFPAPRAVGKPIRYDVASGWLLEAERLAGLEHLDQGCWHPFRRMWATERKGLPVVDVAAAGGWASPRMLIEIYQQPDMQTMLEVVCGGVELRAVGP